MDWPLGRVIKCYPDEKGTVRKVDMSNVNSPQKSIISLLLSVNPKKLATQIPACYKTQFFECSSHKLKHELTQLISLLGGLNSNPLRSIKNRYSASNILGTSMSTV